MHQIPLDLYRIEAPTLENFVVGRNAEACAQMRLLRDGAGQAAPPLVYLWGEAGSGKTHLLLAVADGAAPLDGGSVAATDAPARARFAGSGGSRLVVIDDCERLDATDQERLFHLINRARMHPGTTVLAAGAQPPLALALRDDLRTRLGSGLVYRLKLLGDDEKAAALERVARERGVAIAADVVPWLIAHTSRDIRALLRLFDALDRHAFERKRAITLPLLRELEADGVLAGALPGGRAPGTGRPGEPS